MKDGLARAERIFVQSGIPRAMGVSTEDSESRSLHAREVALPVCANVHRERPQRGGAPCRPAPTPAFELVHWIIMDDLTLICSSLLW